MADSIKFKCACGKTLSADPKYAGKKAKCSNCSQVVVIPAPKAASAAAPAPAAKKVPTAPPTKRSVPPAALSTAKPVSKVKLPAAKPPEKSIFDEEGEYEIDGPAAVSSSCPICGESMPPGAMACPHCGDPLAGKTPPSSATGAKRQLPLWAYFIPLGVYLLLCTIVGMISPGGLLLLTIPVVMIGGLILFIGFLWYYIILVRDHPGEAAFLFFGVLASAFLGVRGSALGRTQRRIQRGRARNPAHKVPVALIILGVSMFACGAAALLIVGFTFGSFAKIKQQRASHAPAFPDTPSASSPFENDPFFKNRQRPSGPPR